MQAGGLRLTLPLQPVARVSGTPGRRQDSRAKSRGFHSLSQSFRSHSTGSDGLREQRLTGWNQDTFLRVGKAWLFFQTLYRLPPFLRIDRLHDFLNNVLHSLSCLNRLFLQFGSASGKKISSIDCPKTEEILNANGRLGSNFPVSTALIVCRETPVLFASSA